MSVQLDLDPAEVLDHLRALGYNHITKDQLKQFIKDLKKLIKYDLRQVQAHQDQENDAPGCYERSPSHRTVQCSPSRNVLREINRAEKPYEDNRSTSIAVQASIPRPNEACSTTTTGTEDPERSAPSSSSGTNATQHSSPKIDSCSCSRPKVGKSSVNKKEQALKPVSSFIRVAPSDVRSGKSDPVTLYHYYQSLWARQNRPGENPHADVRWRIRHKMLGPTLDRVLCGRRTNITKIFSKSTGTMKQTRETIETGTRPTSDKKRENPPWVD